MNVYLYKSVLLQDFGSNKNARIRGVEVNWDLLKPAEAEKTNVLAQSRGNILNNSTRESSLIPVGAVQSNNNSPFSMILFSTHYILPIPLLSFLLILSLMISTIALCQYIRRYKSPTLAIQSQDIQTQNMTKYVERRREWIL